MNSSKRDLRVCFTPALLPFHSLEGSIVVVIDIFRATSSICYGIANGARAIIPVPSVEQCAAYRGRGYLLAAERNGQKVDGFDLGNSPFSYQTEAVKGKTIVLTTTNGTKAIDQAQGAHQIIIGSFLNLSAIVDYLSEQSRDVLLLCAGWKNHFCLEDSLFAGAVVHHLRPRGAFSLDDSSRTAEDLYTLARPDMAGYLSTSSHALRLKNLNIQKDIDFCLQVDLFSQIPVFKEEKLILLT